jgi:hypothetical protein
MEDAGAMWLDFAGGGHAAIWFDYLRPWPGPDGRKWGDDRLRLAGSEGIVEVTHAGTEAVLMTPQTTETLELPDKQSLPAGFIDQLRGRGQCIISAAESFRLTEICLAARDAADTGQIVEI